MTDEQQPSQDETAADLGEPRAVLLFEPGSSYVFRPRPWLTEVRVIVQGTGASMPDGRVSEDGFALVELYDDEGLARQRYNRAVRERAAKSRAEWERGQAAPPADEDDSAAP